MIAWHRAIPYLTVALLLTLSACNSPNSTPNKTPVARDDTFNVSKNTGLDLDVLSNDSDGDGDSLTILGFDASSTQAGRVVRAGTGLRYTPATAFTGTDTFKYRIGDGKGAEASATVTLTVNEGDPNNTPPSLEPISDQTVIRNTLTLNTANINVIISDPDDNSFTVSITSDNKEILPDSSVTCPLASCEVTLAPKLTETVDISVTVTVTDGNGGQAEAIFVLQVHPLLVKSAADNIADSLRAVVAGATPGDIIGFDTAGLFSTPRTITLERQIVLNKDLTIEGPGADIVTVSGANVGRVFKIMEQSSLVISGLTIADGNPPEETHEGEGGPITGAFGGGIFVDVDSSLTLSDSVVKNSKAADFGGGLYLAFQGKLTLENSSFTLNQARNGGGMYVTSGRDLLVQSSTFAHNKATGSGGGIHNENGQLLLRASTVKTNSAGNRGGGIYQASNPTNELHIESSMIGDPDLTDLVAEGNTSNAGGGIFKEDGVLSLLESYVSGNRVTISGGGIFNFTGSLTLDASTVESNQAAELGGGIIIDGFLTLENKSVVKGNIATSATSEGGGIYSLDNVTIDNSEVSENKAASGGGIYMAISFLASSASTLTLRAESVVSFNEASIDGGGIYQRGSVDTVLDDSALISNKTNGNGGGFYIEEGTLSINASSCVVLGNIADVDNTNGGKGGGIYNSGGDISGVPLDSVCQNTPDDIAAP